MNLLWPFYVVACFFYVIFRVSWGALQLALKRAWAGV